jgi:hypothetical protein
VSELLADLPTKWERLGNDIALIPEGTMVRFFSRVTSPYICLWGASERKLGKSLTKLKNARKN